MKPNRERLWPMLSDKRCLGSEGSEGSLVVRTIVSCLQDIVNPEVMPGLQSSVVWSVKDEVDECWS